MLEVRFSIDGVDPSYMAHQSCPESPRAVAQPSRQANESSTKHVRILVDTFDHNPIERRSRSESPRADAQTPPQHNLLEAPQRTRRRSKTYSSKHAEPQYVLVNGDRRAVWPHQWGVTIAQVRDLLEAAKSSDELPWNRMNTMSTLVQDYIIPVTKGKGVGYALLANAEDPQEVNVMISHAWQENAEEFVEHLERTVAADDVMFICALALYQCGDEHGPSILEQLGCNASESPFRKVLEHIKMRGEACGWTWRHRYLLRAASYFIFVGVLTAIAALTLHLGCVPQPDGLCVRQPTWQEAHSPEFQGMFAVVITQTPGDYAHAWPMLEVAMALALFVEVVTRGRRFYHGRMVVCPNINCDIYSRLWCVYEIFVALQLGLPVELARTLAGGGGGDRTLLSPSRNAVCFSDEDRDRINIEIEDFGEDVAGCAAQGYDMVDLAIRRTMSGFYRSTWIHVLRYLWPLLMLRLIMVAALAQHDASPGIGGECGLVFAGIFGSYLALRMVRKAEGELRLVDVLRLGVCQSLGGGILYVGASYLLQFEFGFPWDHLVRALDSFGAFFANMGLTMLVLLLGAVFFPKRVSRLGLCRRRGLALVVMFVVFMIVGLIVEVGVPSARGQVVARLIVQSTIVTPFVAMGHLAVTWGVKLRRPLLHPSATTSMLEPPVEGPATSCVVEECSGEPSICEGAPQ